MTIDSDMMKNIIGAAKYVRDMTENHVYIGEGMVQFTRLSDFLANFSLDEASIFCWGFDTKNYNHQIVAVVDGVRFFTLLTDNEAEMLQKRKDAE